MQAQSHSDIPQDEPRPQISAEHEPDMFFGNSSANETDTEPESDDEHGSESDDEEGSGRANEVDLHWKKKGDENLKGVYGAGSRTTTWRAKRRAICENIVVRSLLKASTILNSAPLSA
jgi:hypothetical protein